MERTFGPCSKEFKDGDHESCMIARIRQGVMNVCDCPKHTEEEKTKAIADARKRYESGSPSY